MKILCGRLSAQPLRPSDHDTAITQAHDELIALINARVHPPSPLTAADVHIRALRLVSDEVNDHGGRFPREEHAHLSELIVDSPVLIGHDHSRLPVARNFAARCLEEEGRAWVEVWFYWLRGDGPHHDQLATDIDAGVIKEGSIAFEFSRPQCSICGEDMRTCDHVPDRDYDVAGIRQTAHYEYRGILRVLETSLVYRGATPNTRIVKYPLFSKLAPSSTAPDTPALLRAFLASRRDLRSFHCPGRTVPWPRLVMSYKAGHGPLASSMRKKVIR